MRRSKMRTPRSAGQFHRFAEGPFSAAANLPERVLRQSQVFVDAALGGIQLQRLLEGLDGELESVRIIVSAAGKIPGVEIVRIQVLRLLEEGLRRVPLFARGANAACQDVCLGITRVERDGAFRFVERSLQLLEVQQSAAQVTRGRRRDRDSAPGTGDKASPLRRHAANDRRSWPVPATVWNPARRSTPSYNSSTRMADRTARITAL